MNEEAKKKKEQAKRKKTKFDFFYFLTFCVFFYKLGQIRSSVNHKIIFNFAKKHYLLQYFVFYLVLFFPSPFPRAKSSSSSSKSSFGEIKETVRLELMWSPNRILSCTRQGSDDLFFR